MSAMLNEGVMGRLASVVDRDPVLEAHFRTGWMWHGDRRVRPSGVDEACCALARQVIVHPDQAVALALPRGNGPLPAMLGLYLMVWRKVLGRQNGRMSGSVAVSTRRAGLRDLCRNLRFDGSDLADTMPVARLIGIPALRRIKPAALTLDRRSVRGISQDDSYLLFAAPNIVPPLPLNVISAMVVDTSGCSVGSWEQTFEHNHAARRRQVWLGELGDERFDSFCEERGIALVRFDWDLLGLAAERWGVGSSPLASVTLAQRALTPPRLAYREVRHEEVEYYLRDVHGALSEMRRHARGQDGPEEVMYAYWAAGLLSRIAYPLRLYEQAASGLSYATTVKWLLDRVEQASATPFRGRWKEAYRSYWPVVTAALKRLVRLLDDDEESPKFWALGERVMDAASNGGLTVVCQTRAEASAARAALTDTLGIGDADMARVTVRSFAQRAAMDGGSSDGPSLLLAPPPERRADIYLSAEYGGCEVLCYEHEVGRLRGRADRAARDAGWDTRNHAALDLLGIAAAPATTAGEPRVRELVNAGRYDADGRFDPAEDSGGDYRPPDADAEFWENARDLLDTEIEARETDPPEETTPAPGAHSGCAVLVTFTEGPRVFFAEDGEVTVVVRTPDGDTVINDTPGRLTAGARVAVLPGAERGSLLAQLMATYDEQLELVRLRYEPMYQRALAAAVDRHGIEELGRLCHRSPEAVRTWVYGWARPGDATALKALLEAAGDEQALRNQAVILHYFNKLRGAHRLIGRVLNDAVSATVLHGPESDSARALSELVGADLSDLFDNTHVLTVSTVSAPRRVPAGICGLFLDPDDPYLKLKGAL